MTGGVSSRRRFIKASVCTDFDSVESKEEGLHNKGCPLL